MRRVLLSTAIFIFFAFACVWATIINVPSDYPTIQQGIDASSDGDTVLAQPGTYVENINFNGQNIVLGSLFLTTNDTSYIPQTIIDGDLITSVIMFESGEDSTAIVSGFTIRNGYKDYHDSTGGGITCRNSANPTILENIIVENVGHGIYCNNSSPAIIGNKIIDQLEYWVPRDMKPGIGVYCDNNSNALIKDNVISNNSGSGVACDSSNSIISNNMITGNTNGGISITESSPTITNNTISNNIRYDAGGISIYGGGPTIINTIVWGNISYDDNEIYVVDATPSITYCDIRGGWNGTGNIDVHPQFIDPSEGNYNLSLTSPCIDAGDPAIQDPDSTRSDIGVYFPDHPQSDCRTCWHISTTGNDSTGDGSSQNPYRTIQYGIERSFWGDTILVENGSYIENINIDSKAILLTSNYMFTGDTLDIQNTVIDGGGISSSVNFAGLCCHLATIAGFTIRNGQNGIYCTSSPIIRNNIITNNDGSGIFIMAHDGFVVSPAILNNYINENSHGGILCSDGDLDGSSLLIVGNIISDNSGYYYGGIFCEGGNGEIKSNLISDNHSTFYGGGISLRFSSAMVSENTITGNSSTNGGGIYSDWGYPIITNNIISDNIANHDGGGLHFDWTSHPYVANNLIINNSATAGGAILCHGYSGIFVNNALYGNIASDCGGGIYCASWMTQPIINTIIWNNVAPVGSQIFCVDGSAPIITYCDIQDTLWPGEGNISADPLFRDPDNGDFHLMAPYCGDPFTSPCIDAGDPAILDSLLDCGWGMGWYRSDMGAYGGGDSIAVGIDDYVDLLPKRMVLMQNYPNPFNGQTTIKFVLQEPQNVLLTVYDPLGRRVRTLIDEYRQAGAHTFIFDAPALSSGVYFYRLQAGEVVETKRMVLLK